MDNINLNEVDNCIDLLTEEGTTIKTNSISVDSLELHPNELEVKIGKPTKTVLAQTFIAGIATTIGTLALIKLGQSAWKWHKSQIDNECEEDDIEEPEEEK